MIRMKEIYHLQELYSHSFNIDKQDRWDWNKDDSQTYMVKSMNKKLKKHNNRGREVV